MWFNQCISICISMNLKFCPNSSVILHMSNGYLLDWYCALHKSIIRYGMDQHFVIFSFLFLFLPPTSTPPPPLSPSPSLVSSIFTSSDSRHESESGECGRSVHNPHIVRQVLLITCSSAQ